VPGRPRPAPSTPPIARDPRNREKMRGRQGRIRKRRHPWRLLERFAGAATAMKPALASLVECRLETGRTHQIRVHMAHLGHPLLGDAALWRRLPTKAGKPQPEPARARASPLGRQALHAAGLDFHPRNRPTRNTPCCRICS
jgi:23S rRNA pseudouridine1911/1915/1917 synthase